MNVALIPCNQQGKPLSDDMFNEDPDYLLSKPYNFKVNKIKNLKY